MEVHHHSHTSRKKWTHYFWEFLMLFLAVFCGFLAEYQLEHKIEKERENQYMHALLTDLAEDRRSLNNTIDDVRFYAKGLDSLILALRQPMTVQRNINLVYLFFAKYGQNISQTYFHEGTSTQLKNSGGLRLIKDKELVNKFNAYESVKADLKITYEDLWRLITKIEEDYANRLLDFTTPQSFLNLPLTELNKLNADSLLNLPGLVILDNSPGGISNFRNLIRSLKLREENYLYWTTVLRKLNGELTETVKSVYRIK